MRLGNTRSTAADDVTLSVRLFVTLSVVVLTSELVACTAGVAGPLQVAERSSSGRVRRQLPPIEQGNVVIDSIFQIPIITLNAVGSLIKNARPLVRRTRERIQQYYTNGQQQPYSNGQQQKPYSNGQQPYGNGQQYYGNGQQYYGNGQQYYGNGQQYYGNGQQRYKKGKQRYDVDDHPHHNSRLRRSAVPDDEKYTVKWHRAEPRGNRGYRVVKYDDSNEPRDGPKPKIDSV